MLLIMKYVILEWSFEVAATEDETRLKFPKKQENI